MTARVDGLHRLRILALALLVVGAALVSSCDTGSPATLTIRNNSSITLERVSWRSRDFGDIAPGTDVTRTVDGITSGAPICVYIGKTEYFSEDILVEPGKEVTYVFTNSTQLTTYK